MLGWDFYDESDNEIESENDLFLLNDIQYNFNTRDYLVNFFNISLNSLNSHSTSSNETHHSKVNDNYFLKCLILIPKEDQELFHSFKL